MQYTYVVFKSHDVYELPIKYYDTVSQISKDYNIPKSTISARFKKGNIIKLNENYKLERFKMSDRFCDVCGKEMHEGFVIDGGCEYYCSEECLHKHYTPKEWEEMYNDDGDSYWTEWE